MPSLWNYTSMTVYYEFEIPDPSRPLSEDESGYLGPSGELIPFLPSPIFAEQVIGRVINEFSSHVGTYGMGGPGFVGLRLGNEWLVISIWGAAEWMMSQGRCIEDTFHEAHARPTPWLPNDKDDFERQVVGRCIRSIDVQQHSLCIVLENGFDLTIEESSERRPQLEGAKKPREFALDDDLRKAVFLAPTNEIWV